MAALIEFDKVCSENSIKYSLIGGTLLGAIHHCLFIHWDDDIDVCMMRSECEMLLDVGKNIIVLIQNVNLKCQSLKKNISYI